MRALPLNINSCTDIKQFLLCRGSNRAKLQEILLNVTFSGTPIGHQHLNLSQNSKPNHPVNQSSVKHKPHPNKVYQLA